jgi:acyl-CoA synthetase (AMP-forming)/AMP-acid ligase II
VHNVYPTFGSSGTLYAYPKRYMLENIGKILLENKLTTIQCTPSILSAIPLDCAASLESLFVSGEVFPPKQMERWAARVPYVFNKYGPTEAAVDVLATRCSTSMPFPSSIGRPFPNVRIYIADPTNPAVLMPPGVPGELLISGAQVGRGYLKLPDLTSERFISNPFCSNEPLFEKIYRTGDLCRWLPDGSISFICRIDSQVKLRGYRIELSEIESVLLAHHNVSSSAVVKKDRKRPLLSPAEPTWKQVFEHVYAQADPFSRVGWIDSRTMQPYSDESMNEWIACTVEYIRRHMNLKSVLEVGCGTGMIIEQIIGSIKYYLGLDLAPSIIELLSRRMGNANVQFLTMEATHIHQLPRRSYTAVIMNSVIQYFPTEVPFFSF